MATRPPRGTPVAFSWPGESWHPIFYDLSFVAVVLVLADAFAVDHSLSMAAWLLLVFGVLWLLWFVTMLLERRRPVGALRVGVLTVQMALLLAAAMASDDTIADNSPWFAALVGVALLLTSLLVRPGQGPENRRPFVGLLVAAAAWLVSVALWSSWLVLGAWAVALLAMLFTARELLMVGGADQQRLGRRLGELTVVVIGESFLKVGLAAGDVPVNEVSVLGLAIVFVVCTCVWWDYFIGPRLAPHGATHTLVWATGQWAMHLALIWLAVGLAKILVDASHLDPEVVASLVVLPAAVLTASLAYLDIVSGVGAAGLRLTVHAAQTLVLVALALALWLGGWPDTRVAGLVVALVVAGGALALAATAVAEGEAFDREHDQA